MNKPLYHSLKSGSPKTIVERYKQDVIWEAILEEYRNEEDRVGRKSKKGDLK